MEREEVKGLRDNTDMEKAIDEQGWLTEVRQAYEDAKREDRAAVQPGQDTPNVPSASNIIQRLQTSFPQGRPQTAKILGGFLYLQEKYRHVPLALEGIGEAARLFSELAQPTNSQQPRSFVDRGTQDDSTRLALPAAAESVAPVVNRSDPSFTATAMQTLALGTTMSAKEHNPAMLGGHPCLSAQSLSSPTRPEALRASGLIEEQQTSGSTMNSTVEPSSRVLKRGAPSTEEYTEENRAVRQKTTNYTPPTRSPIMQQQIASPLSQLQASQDQLAFDESDFLYAVTERATPSEVAQDQQLPSNMEADKTDGTDETDEIDVTGKTYDKNETDEMEEYRRGGYIVSPLGLTMNGGSLPNTPVLSNGTSRTPPVVEALLDFPLISLQSPESPFWPDGILRMAVGHTATGHMVVARMFGFRQLIYHVNDFTVDRHLDEHSHSVIMVQDFMVWTNFEGMSIADFERAIFRMLERPMEPPMAALKAIRQTGTVERTERVKITTHRLGFDEERAVCEPEMFNYTTRRRNEREPTDETRLFDVESAVVALTQANRRQRMTAAATSEMLRETTATQGRELEVLNQANMILCSDINEAEMEIEDLKVRNEGLEARLRRLEDTMSPRGYSP